MIPQIKEVNLPSYATLHQATVSLADMGDRTITATVKIDGSQRPEFIGTDGNDWELQFRGERYIHPLREPQARKDNSSVMSMVDLTFYHWAIWQMKRYFFVALANVESSTPMVDKYIVPLALNLPEFARALDDILKYYMPGREVYVYKQGDSYINPDFDDYDHQTKYIEIDHTYIWEVLQKTYELFGCRWYIEKDAQGKYAIKFGYTYNVESSHIFQYGYEGGLLSVERQVQDDSIRNQLLGRGGSKNIPYMYFKDFERFHPNSDNEAYKNIGLPDPDAVPELESIMFSELREDHFRSYIQGWKVNVHRQDHTDDGWSVTHNAEGTVFTESNGDTYSLDTARLATDWAYAKGATDTKFDPVEYVKDDESIATYGLLQGGLANDEDVFPTIQGMELELPCDWGSHDTFPAVHDVRTLADEIVDVEEVVTDVIKSGGDESVHYTEEVKSADLEQRFTPTRYSVSGGINVIFPAWRGTIKTNTFEVKDGFHGNIVYAPKISATVNVYIKTRLSGQPVSWPDIISAPQPVSMNVVIEQWAVYDAATNTRMPGVTNLPAGTYYIEATYFWHGKLTQFLARGNQRVVGYQGCDPVITTLTAVNDNYNFYGEVLPNTGQQASTTVTVAAGGDSTFTLIGSRFTVPPEGALMIDCPINFSPKEFAVLESTIKVLDVDQGIVVPASNIPEGNYELRVEIKLSNTDLDNAHQYDVSLGVAFLYYNRDNEEWKPTFDIWIKNVFQTDRKAYSSDDEYMRAVWEPLISTQDMTVSFATGNLSRHSDWEFKVARGGIAYDNSKTLTVKDEDGVEHEVRSEWRLTLIKSDAEADSIHKYVPYKDFNAAPYDRFVFTNIYLPWAYVYAAEKLLTAKKETKLVESKDIQPTWVVKVDKIRLQEIKRQQSDIEPLFWTILPGDKVWIKDDRFTAETGVQLYITSMTYNWQDGTVVLPDLEVVLSDKVEASMTTVERMQSDIQVLSNQIKGLSQLESAIRAVGDAVYLRKDGFEDTSYSPTNVAKRLSSRNFRPGIVGGTGWSADSDENGDSTLEIDRLIVRKEMQVNNLVINQVSSMGGKEILSAASMEVSRVDSAEDGFVCYFDQHNGTIANLFVVDDIAYSQVYDEHNNEAKYYKRRVVGVGPDYIVLSYDEADGEGSPAVGDVIAQFGNYTDANRQFVIVRDVIGGGYEQMLSGLNSVDADGEEYYFAGAENRGSSYVSLFDVNDAELLDSNDSPLRALQRINLSPRWFVGQHSGEYAEWVDGELTVKGNIIVKKTNGGYSGLTSLVDALQEDDDITTISGGLVLSKIIGVVSNNEMVAGLNASSLGADSTHGKLMLFAGAADGDHVSTATFRVYEDGRVVATDADIAGKITAQKGAIGNFEINSSGWLHVTSGNSDVTYLNSAKLVFTNLTEEVSQQFGTTEITTPNAFASLVLFRKDATRRNIGAFINVPDSTTSRYQYSIYAVNGIFAGLRPYIDRFSSNVTLDNMLFTCIITANMSVTLPLSPKIGQTYLLLCQETYSIRIVGNGKNIHKTGTSTAVSYIDLNVWAGIAVLVYDGTEWTLHAS